MNPALLKGLLGLGVVGGGAGLSIGGYYLLKPSEPKTLLEKFQRENVDILYGTGVKESDWNTKLNAYKSADESNKFSDLTKTNPTFDELKNECKKNLEKPIEQSKDIEGKVKQWCTKDKSQA